VYGKGKFLWGGGRNVAVGEKKSEFFVEFRRKGRRW